MNVTKISIYLSALTIALLLAACGTSQTIGTGIPASGADKFYFHMEQEASARGFDTYRDMELLVLEVAVGDDMALNYNVMGDEIMVTMHVDDLGDGSEEQVRHRLAELGELNRAMIAVAADRADRARVFELVEW